MTSQNTSILDIRVFYVSEINLCKCMDVFCPLGMKHFEGSMMTIERGFPDDGTRVVPKHDGDLLRSDKHVFSC
jgi:hypothetical protein